MRIFVTVATGFATGFIGSAVVKELLDAGHQVIGIARSDEKAKTPAATGAEVFRGSLEDLDSLRGGAATADAVIHTAFNHDFSKFAENSELDRRAIEALGKTLAGTDRPLPVTPGLALLRKGDIGTKEDESVPPSAFCFVPRARRDEGPELIQ